MSEPNSPPDFYEFVVSKADIAADDSVLVVCGGPYDKDILLKLGVRTAVISNVDHHDGIHEYAPYEWSRQDAEALSLSDQSFDWAVVHAGLHHCGSPHRAMCEMLRVAKKGIVVIESRDSFLMRVAVLLGMTREYELEPAALTGGRSGGLRNTHIPNFIYRWTERDVDKTVRSFLPQHKSDVRYFYRYKVPLQRMTMSTSWIKRLIARIAEDVIAIPERLIPQQANLFGFIVRKGGQMQPWLKGVNDALVVDMDYVGRIYDPKKYQKNFVR